VKEKKRKKQTKIMIKEKKTNKDYRKEKKRI